MKLEIHSLSLIMEVKERKGKWLVTGVGWTIGMLILSGVTGRGDHAMKWVGWVAIVKRGKTEKAMQCKEDCGK